MIGSGNASVASRETQRDLTLSMRHIRVRFPHTLREFFQLLGSSGPKATLDVALDLIDFTGITPIEICELLHGRAADPESVQDALLGATYDPRQHVREAFLSPEFRSRVVSKFLTAFSAMPRDVFIHVPKCAGTDLIFNLVQRQLPLPKVLEIGEWIKDDDYFAALAGIARAAPFFERVFVYGHMELGEYADTCGIRPGDKVFTIIRDPVDLMISQVNYAIGRLRQDPRGRDPDAAENLQLLGLDRFDHAASNQELKDLALRALYDPRVARPNQACFYLGKHADDAKSPYQSAMGNLVAHDAEITTTEHYEAWLKGRWGIGKSDRRNASDPILTRREVLRLATNDWLSSFSEDRKLFDVTSWAIRQAGTASIKGADIARIVGRGLLDDAPSVVRHAASAIAVLGNGAFVVAQEPAHVAFYLQRSSPSVTQAWQLFFAADFGLGENGRDCLRAGWAATEATFTWTLGHECVIALPPVPQGQDILVRLVGNPFVHGERLPAQRLEFSIDGRILAECRIRDLAVIELDVPASLERPDGPFTVTLRLPDAAQPSGIQGNDDDRLLAFALHRIEVMVSPQIRSRSDAAE